MAYSPASYRGFCIPGRLHDMVSARSPSAGRSSCISPTKTTQCLHSLAVGCLRHALPHMAVMCHPTEAPYTSAPSARRPCPRAAPLVTEGGQELPLGSHRRLFPMAYNPASFQRGYFRPSGAQPAFSGLYFPSQFLGPHCGDMPAGRVTVLPSPA